MNHIAIIGGGLAGCECAWKIAARSKRAVIHEMRPERTTPAHATGKLAELVCSNSLRSSEPTTAIGLLKEEMRALDSLVMAAADATAIPAGKALAVDRDRFSDFIEEKIAANTHIEVARHEIASLDDPALAEASAIVIAAGPLASDSLSASLADALGDEHLYFYDAIAPIIAADSVDMDHAFWGSRYRPEDSDYLNCPLTEAQYHAFIAELKAADKVAAREFEKQIHFEGCLPIEELAERGDMTLAFGPLKPVGLTDPRTGQTPFAVLQLRAENEGKTAFNLVGFQTKLTYPEQKRVFAMIPALKHAEFLRLGSIHRNTFVNAPKVLTPNLELATRPGVYLAGQITGVEGYLESAACGLVCGLILATDHPFHLPPQESALGALMNHLRTPAKHFQPSNANFGLMPPLNRRAPKKIRKDLYAQRAREAFAKWMEECEGETS